MKPHLKIDIVSDVVCPWCYIGKRRLEKAIEQLKDDYTFELRYLPFQLSPDTPAEGENTKERLVAKFGSEDRYNQIIQQVSGVAAAEGLRFDLENQTVSPNTHTLHRLIGYAQQQGKQLEMVETLFKAYFEDTVDLTQTETVVQLATSIGLDAEKVREVLVGNVGAEELDKQLYQNRLMGVSGVPYYIINDKYAVSGAQPTELFLEALPEIALKAPIQAPVAAGEACDIETGVC
ncbi:DsbA family oxidoreductase [Runella salmonicolor]|uniref:DsbA family oxidoreductase n=1 Tax=Runella salmonicolor TaxID=2950278 RepID=A0ABT1FLA2_9BACT|nr:DsbA family oxidoreductase [Runella salmonicolor]MCP1382511.1 DsbA family oxidoreductase [Runella salmonicolor]